MKKSKIIVFVEDPGAANFIIKINDFINIDNHKFCFIVYGAAKKIFNDFKINYIDFEKINLSIYLDKFSPNMVLVGTSQNFQSPAFKFIEYANQKNILSVGFVDMATDAHLRFSGTTSDPLANIPNYLFVADDETKKEFINLGLKDFRIFVTGHPAHDHIINMKNYYNHLDKKKFIINLLGLNPSPRKIIIFAAEHILDYKENENLLYTLNGRGNNKSRTKIVLEEFLDAVKNITPLPYIILRLHPKNKIDDFNEYKNEIDLLSFHKDHLQYLWVADLVVGMSSNLLMESVIMGKKTLSILTNESEKKWGPSVAKGFTPYVTKREKIYDNIQSILSNSQKVHIFEKNNSSKTIIVKINELLKENIL